MIDGYRWNHLIRWNAHSTLFDRGGGLHFRASFDLSVQSGLTKRRCPQREITHARRSTGAPSPLGPPLSWICCMKISRVCWFDIFTRVQPNTTKIDKYILISVLNVLHESQVISNTQSSILLRKYLQNPHSSYFHCNDINTHVHQYWTLWKFLVSSLCLVPAYRHFLTWLNCLFRSKDHFIYTL